MVVLVLVVVVVGICICDRLNAFDLIDLFGGLNIQKKANVPKKKYV